MRPQATFSSPLFHFNPFSSPLFHFFSFFNSPRRFSISSLLLPFRSFLHFKDPKHCPNHLESVKIHFSQIVTKAVPTDRARTDKASSGDVRTHLKTHLSTSTTYRPVISPARTFFATPTTSPSPTTFSPPAIKASFSLSKSASSLR